MFELGPTPDVSVQQLTQLLEKICTKGWTGFSNFPLDQSGNDHEFFWGCGVRCGKDDEKQQWDYLAKLIIWEYVPGCLLLYPHSFSIFLHLPDKMFVMGQWQFLSHFSLSHSFSISLAWWKYTEIFQNNYLSYGSLRFADGLTVVQHFRDVIAGVPLLTIIFQAKQV